MISIHALRVEGDFDSIRHLLTPSISIHALRVEGDSRMLSASGVTTDFYPRPPGGGRLANENCQPKTPVYFYPRPPGGGRLCRRQMKRIAKLFLSTPSGWRATVFVLTLPVQFRFLSTPSGWRATDVPIHVLRDHVEISIHALRVEGDCCLGLDRRTARISIHALRVEGDRPQIQKSASAA